MLRGIAVLILGLSSISVSGLGLEPGELRTIMNLNEVTMDRGFSPVMWIGPDGETRFSIFVDEASNYRIETYGIDKNLVSTLPVGARGWMNSLVFKDRALMVLAKDSQALVVDLKAGTSYVIPFPYVSRPAGEEYFRLVEEVNGEPTLLWVYRDEQAKVTHLLGYGLDSRAQVFSSEIPGLHYLRGYAFSKRDGGNYLTVTLEQDGIRSYSFVTLKPGNPSEIVRVRENASCNSTELVNFEVPINGMTYLAVPGAGGCNIKDAGDPRFDGERGDRIVFVDPLSLEIHSTVPVPYSASCWGSCVRRLHIFGSDGGIFALANSSDPQRSGSLVLDLGAGTWNRLGGVEFVRPVNGVPVGFGPADRVGASLRVVNLVSGAEVLYGQGPKLNRANISVSGGQLLIGNDFYVHSPRMTGLHLFRAW